MLNEEEYASSTDDSDDDYNPEGNNSDAASEVDTDDETENNDENNKSGTQKRKGKSSASAAKKAKLQTPQSSQSHKSANDRSISPVKTLSDDDEDSNEDALWTSFLGKTDNGATKTATVTTKKVQTPAKSTMPSAPLKTTTQKASNNTTGQISSNITTKPKIVTEIFEFAGEKVEVQKEIKTDNSVDTAAGVSASSASQNKSRIGNSGGSGGLASVLGQIGKKNKLSILQKTQIDWSGFKNKEGIDEELQTFNKGRDGYLERQDFLQRTDLRQFEREKDMRQTTRRK